MSKQPDAPSATDLRPDNCEREPIRIPGAIQPHGALLAFDPATGSVLHASDNIDHFLSLGGLPAQDRHLSDLLGTPAADLVLDGIRSATQGGVTAPLNLRLQSEGLRQALDASVHVHRGVGVLEVEFATDARTDWVPVFTDAMQRMRDSASLEDLMALVAGRIKRMTGFDQVMVYRFDEVWNGQVIAERCEPDMESFLGLCFPATDIPAQARELYLTNLVRHIPDVNYEPVPVRPTVDRSTNLPLDMSHAQLRSVSPMHLLYLRNMGVRSTLVLSIVVQGRLWGLVSCHHRAPQPLSQGLRAACRLISLSLGYMLSAHLQQQAHRNREALGTLQVGILKVFNQPHAALRDIVEGISTDLLRLAGAASGVLWHGGEHIVFGQPIQGTGPQLVEHVKQLLQHNMGAPIFKTQFGADLPGLGFFGLAAITLDPFAESGLLWLRPEWVREVHWGGNPDKAMNLQVDAQGQTVLTPRNSFAQFLQVARGESRPWDDDTRAAIIGLAGVQDSLVVRESLAKVVLSDRRFRSLVALQSDCYWQTDVEGRIMVLSRNLGFDEQVVNGSPLVQLYACRAVERDLDTLGHALAGLSSFRELSVSAPEGVGERFFAHQISGEPIRDRSGVVVGMHGTISDVTERRLDEMRLVEAERRAQAAAEAKGTFLAMMSHEIRTPLNGVIGYLDLLSGMPLEPVSKRYVNAAKSASNVLFRVINDVLDLSRIEAKMLDVTPSVTLLRPVLEEVVALAATSAQRKDLELRTRFAGNMPERWLVDDMPLRQVLLNLLNNAIKFTDHGSVTFAVKNLQARPGLVRLLFTVSDTGIGMDAEQRQRVLEPFQQADVGITRRYGGTGLGLTISQRLLKLMGSDGLTIESEPGQGSVFSFELESDSHFSPQEVVHETPENAAVTLPAGLRVLLVEDNAANIEIALALLDRIQAEASIAIHGEDALELLRQHGPAFDVVFMDIQMPVMDGLTATREIRKNPDWAGIPVLALTANAYESDREQCLAAGMNGFLAKPFDLQQLCHAVSRVLAQRPQTEAP